MKIVIFAKGWPVGRLAVGLFCLAAVASVEGRTNMEVMVRNDLDVARPGQIIELDWRQIIQRNAALKADAVAVQDATGQTLICQAVDENGDGVCDVLLAQVDFAVRETRQFRVVTGQAGVPSMGSRVHAMFYPRRADDFSWENDRIAFRMYGPALMKLGPPQSGVDVWCKHVPELVALKLYKGNYHKDNGLGVDAYGVGTTRGCGGTAIWRDNKLYASRNFVSWKIIADGPLRTIFELTYAPWDAGGVPVTEVKRISLDAGSQLNRMESRFYFKDTASLTAAAGLAIHKGGEATVNGAEGWAAVWEPADGEGNGMLGTGLVSERAVKAEYRQALRHALALIPVKPGEAMVYYAGAGWSKYGYVDAAAWQAYLADFARKLNAPLEYEWR